MAKEYQKTQVIDRPADEAFAWLKDVSNLPHYLPPIKSAEIEGPSAEGAPGERVSLEGEIPDRGEFESKGYFSADEGERRMEWGAEADRDYSGWLQVSGREDGKSEVTVHLNFGERSVEDQIQQESREGRDPLEEALAATMESIRRQLEEGSGKVQPPSSRG